MDRPTESVRPPLSVRILIMGLLGPCAVFFLIVVFEAVRQSASNWPGSLILVALAAAVALVAINTVGAEMSVRRGELVVRGLVRKRLPLSEIAEFAVRPSRSYAGLQLLSVVGTDGNVLHQFPPIWDLKAVESWAESVPIRFTRGSQRRPR